MEDKQQEITQEPKASETKGRKFGNFMLKIFNPLKNNWGRITLIGSGVIAVGVAVGTWAVNDFSMEYFNELINAVKQLIALF